MILTTEAAQAILDRIHIGNVKQASTQIGGYAHYCGRQMRDRVGSALHNPHNAQGTCRTCGAVHGSGGQTLPYFEPEFRAKVKARDAAIMAELRSIWRQAKQGDVTLLCWCAPAPCHTNIIKQVLLELATGQL